MKNDPGGAPVGTGAQNDVLVFIGSKQCFSDVLLRTIAGELDNSQAVRFDELSEFQNYIQWNPSPIGLVVVEAQQCQQDQELCKSILDTMASKHPSIRLAVAYWEADLDRLLSRRFSARMLDSARDIVQGYVPMNVGIDIWLSVIRLLICGGDYFPPEVVVRREALYREWDASKTEDAIPERTEVQAAQVANGARKNPLTKRETQVIEHVVGGMQNKEIARKLKLSEHTVKLHIHHIISKMSAKNRTEAAMRYMNLKGAAR
ncbi:response regulator transcription factor [Profundibacter sp.]